VLQSLVRDSTCRKRQQLLRMVRFAVFQPRVVKDSMIFMSPCWRGFGSQHLDLCRFIVRFL
jgi:hypothetical protein